MSVLVILFLLRNPTFGLYGNSQNDPKETSMDSFKNNGHTYRWVVIFKFIIALCNKAVF